MIEQKEKLYLTEYQKTLLEKGQRLKLEPNLLHYRKNGKTEIITELILARLEADNKSLNLTSPVERA